MASVDEIRNAQRAQGPATVLAIGTATPDNCLYQSDFADYYFRVTKSEHMTELKKKFNRICKYNFNVHNMHTVMYTYDNAFIWYSNESFYTHFNNVDHLEQRIYILLN